jgi:hypothetical protein
MKLLGKLLDRYNVTDGAIRFLQGGYGQSDHADKNYHANDMSPPRQV